MITKIFRWLGVLLGPILTALFKAGKAPREVESVGYDEGLIDDIQDHINKENEK